MSNIDRAISSGSMLFAKAYYYCLWQLKDIQPWGQGSQPQGTFFIVAISFSHFSYLLQVPDQSLLFIYTQKVEVDNIATDKAPFSSKNADIFLIS